MGLELYANGTRSRQSMYLSPLTAVSLALNDKKDRHETGLRGWAERTRTRKCRFTQRLAELLGFPEHFGTRDFSCFPGAPLSVGRQKPA